MSTAEELITIDELAEIWKCKKSYIYRLTSQRRIPFYRVGGLKFKRSEANDWLQKQRSHIQKPRTVDEIFS
jgi:excisionase family DNA binding protein